MRVACNRARFPATWPRVFCELKIMKMVILIHQIIQERFAYGELFYVGNDIHTYLWIVKKMQNSGFEIVARLTLPLSDFQVSKRILNSILWWTGSQ